MALFLRKRRVRLHLKDENRSLEGIWIGMGAGHYRLASATQLEAVDRTIELEGEAWVPRERVLYMQVIG
jgi:hypothetical protein